MDDRGAVFLRPIGSPMPLGLSGLVAASLVSSGLDLGWVSVGEQHAVALVLLAFAFPAQLVASLFSFLARDGAIGTALGVLSVTWLTTALVFLAGTPGSTTSTLGLLLLAVAGLLGTSAAAAARGNPLAGAVFGTAALRFALAGIYELSAAEFWQNAAGIVGLVLVALAGFAMAKNEFRAAAVKPLEAEPGVRERL
jgi:succinate-acetate transporter protein